MSRNIVYLMYHEIETPGRALLESEPGYVRYVVTESSFRRHLEHLRAKGFRGVSVSEALSNRNKSSAEIAVTFDDGCETDLLTAAPMLKEFGFNATFYIITGRIGERGYLGEGQLRELRHSGFEIGCHSMTHRFLTDMDSTSLRNEIIKAKAGLEQIIGEPVSHLSCPGGRWNHKVARAAREAGFVSVATSRIGSNSPEADRYCLARVPIMRSVAINEFDRICRSKGFAFWQVRVAALAAAKRLFGNSTYEKLRAVVLGRPAATEMVIAGSDAPLAHAPAPQSEAFKLADDSFSANIALETLLSSRGNNKDNQ